MVPRGDGSKQWRSVHHLITHMYEAFGPQKITSAIYPLARPVGYSSRISASVFTFMLWQTSRYPSLPLGTSYKYPLIFAMSWELSLASVLSSFIIP